MCHLSWFQKLSPAHTHPLTTICEFLKPYELLFSELVTHVGGGMGWDGVGLGHEGVGVGHVGVGSGGSKLKLKI